MKPKKIGGLWRVVDVDDESKIKHSKRFEDEESCMKFIRKNARENNWVAGKEKEFKKTSDDKLTDLGKNVKKNIKDESICEDTVKQGSKWVNKGKEGTHGKFKTKKAADAQRKAMFANGYKGEELIEAHADLSQKEHTIAHALERTKDEWANAKTEKEAVSILRRALEDEGLNTPASRKFLWHISNQPLSKIIETATNYWMSGADLSMKKGTPGYDKGFRGKHEALTEEESDQVAIDKLKAGATLKDALR